MGRRGYPPECLPAATRSSTLRRPRPRSAVLRRTPLRLEGRLLVGQHARLGPRTPANPTAALTRHGVLHDPRRLAPPTSGGPHCGQQDGKILRVVKLSRSAVFRRTPLLQVLEEPGVGVVGRRAPPSSGGPHCGRSIVCSVRPTMTTRFPVLRRTPLRHMHGEVVHPVSAALAPPYSGGPHCGRVHRSSADAAGDPGSAILRRTPLRRRGGVGPDARGEELASPSFDGHRCG